MRAQGSTPSEAITLIDGTNYDDMIAKGCASGKTVLVDFFAEWCGPCKVMYPKVVEIAEANADKLIVYKFDCNKANKDKAKELGIKVLPTFMAYKGGVKVGESTGAKMEKLQELLASAM